MIDGVTILKQYDASLSIGLIIFFSILIGMLGFLLILGKEIIYGTDQYSVSTSIIMGIIIAVICFFLLKSENTPNIHYEVIIDDSVSVNELYKNYEILNIDGKIYTISLREE